MTAEKNRELPGLRVLAHPLRLRLLSLLGASTLSASEAARQLGETQANVSYHMRRLHAAGLLEVVEEVAIRGGTAKRYRHDPNSGESFGRDDTGGHALLMATMAAELTRRAAEYRLGSRDAFTDAEFWIDPASWEKAMDLVREAGIQLADGAQPPGSDGTIRVSATISLFELNPRPADSTPTDSTPGPTP